MSNNVTFLELSQGLERVVIELGPGYKKKYPEAIGIDQVKLPGVDIVADVQQGLAFIPDDSVDLIYSSHFLEHVNNLEFIFKEFYRILRPGGCVISVVPHFSNPYYYSDYTHKNFWGLYTPFYFSENNYYKRKVLSFYNDTKFKVVGIKLKFYSPFPIRNLIKKVFHVLFNINSYTQELYEEFFTHWIPAYELVVNMEKPQRIAQPVPALLVDENTTNEQNLAV